MKQDGCTHCLLTPREAMKGRGSKLALCLKVHTFLTLEVSLTLVRLKVIKS